MKLLQFLSLSVILLTQKAAPVISPPIVKADLCNQEKYSQQKQIPVLCYHNIESTNGKEDVLWIGKPRLNEQMKMLYDSGYHTILPDQLYRYLTVGTALPAKPILLCFDDGHEEHFSIAAHVLSTYRFKAVFFPMTVTIGKKGYMSAAQLQMLSDSGHAIGVHTWDHPDMTRLRESEWEQQLSKPKALLETITGRPVVYFAYPYGAWNDAATMELKKRGIKAAFQLTGKQSAKEPLFTIRRLMASGSWSGVELYRQIKSSF